MGVTIPNELIPLVSALGIRWPDIDEDKVRALGDTLATFGDDLSAIAEQVSGVLKRLAAENDSEALNSVRDHWATIVNEYVVPATSTESSATRNAFLIASDAVYTYKMALFVEIGVIIGGTAVAAAASGGLAGAAEAIVERVGGRAVIERVLSKVTEDAVRRLVADLERALDEGVVGVVKTLTQPLITAIETGAYDVVANVVPQMNLMSQIPVATVGGSTRALVISAESLDTAVTDIGQRADMLSSAIKKLIDGISSNDLRSPVNGDVDHYPRDHVHSAVTQLTEEIANAFGDLCTKLLEHCTGLVVNVQDVMGQLDQELGGRARLLSGEPVRNDNIA